MGAIWTKKSGIGCGVVSVDYEYNVSGTKYAGSYNRPFVFSSSGNIYIDYVVRAREKDRQFRVRIKPENPSTSIADYKPLDIHL